MKKKKENMRGSIDALEVGGSVEFKRVLYRLSSVRATASSITADTRKKFRVSGSEGNPIVVTREA